MIRTILESCRYSGLMFPVAFLRMYVGYNFLINALEKIQSDFLVHPRMAAKITEWLPYSGAPQWYINWLEIDIIPNENWKILAYIVTYIELFIGFTFLVGFLIRPFAILGMLLMIHYIGSQGGELVSFYQLQMILFLTLLWLGAGRCLGLDYYFYKRQRGFLW